MPSDAGLVTMTSPEGTGAVDDAVATPEPQIAAASAARGENGRNSAAAPGDAASSAEAADPWFTPGPKVSGEWTADAGDAIGTDDYATAEWFLPTGRAGLLPDSMTQSSDSNGAPVSADRRARPEAGGSPPWTSDIPGSSDGEPPPWENGPWPGPGERASAPRTRPPIPASGAAQATDDRLLRDVLRLRSTRLILAGGAAALVLIAVIVIILTGTSGGSGGGCGTYPAAVRQAYAKAMGDISGSAPASVQATDLGLAARRANASAASAGKLSVRTALFAMANDLEQAHADVAAHRAIPADLQQHLADDGTALPGSCPS
jgi:hypothetical protein